MKHTKFPAAKPSRPPSPIHHLEALEPRIAPAGVSLNLGTLDGDNGFKLSGASSFDYAGYSVGSAGDINGDGFDDVVVGAFYADSDGVKSGAAYLVFGKAGGFAKDLRLSKLDGTNGFKLSGEATNDQFGWSVSGAGDVNGDGFDDLLIGAPNADANGSNSGVSYVLFGKSGGFAKNLRMSELDGNNGFKLSGTAAGHVFGRTVSGAGDMNGDGFDDLIVGAPGNRSVYVVFGKAGGFVADVDLSTLTGEDGFTVSGPSGEGVGTRVSGAGDVNGDGYDDIIIGAPDAESSYVVFGKPGGFAASVNVSSLDGLTGFRLNGVGGAFFGRSLSSAGDINGDGFGDLVIGASYSDANGARSGASYVVYGKSGGFTAVFDVSTLDGSNGFTLVGAPGSYAGISVSEAGDFNGDGFADLIIGSGSFAAGNDDELQRSSGRSYVIFGQPTGLQARLDLSALNGINGFEIRGAARGDFAGISVSGAGDINGDGFDDLIVGAHYADPNGSTSGASYVIFGRTPPPIKTITLVEPDGNMVTVQVSKGGLTAENLVFAPDGALQQIDLKGDARFTGSNITITAKSMGIGDGAVDLELLEATGLNLGNVKISGTLGTIMAGDNVLAEPAIKSLTVGSLGTTELVTEPLLSEVAGSLGKLTVKGDVRGAALSVSGKLGKVTIGGDLVGDSGAGAAMFASIMEGRGIDPRVGGGIPVGAVAAGSIASFTVKGSMNGGSVSAEGNIGKVDVKQDVNGAAIAAAGQIKVVKVFGDLSSDDPTQPTLVAALAKMGSTKPKGAVAIDNLTVRGDVENAQILLGYQKQVAGERTSYVPKNPDASAGKVLIKGNWVASSLVAGVFDATGDGFGRNDELITGDKTSRIYARIASIVIKGTATGSAAEGDHFAITAQQIGKLSIAGEKISLNKDKIEKDDVLLDEINRDFRVVEV